MQLPCKKLYDEIYLFSGHRICSYPGCNKWCYVEQGTGRVHDYCNRTHADQHKVMLDKVWRQHWEKQQQHYPGGSHQSTRSKSGEILASLHMWCNALLLEENATWFWHNQVMHIFIFKSHSIYIPVVWPYTFIAIFENGLHKLPVDILSK